MLTELHVRDLGILDDVTLSFGAGLTAITGETGAGKTLLVGAIQLLLGGRADSSMVRGGASEARVEGRFVSPLGDEVVLARVVPHDGRSRAYVDGRLATVAELASAAAELVDLHGQHAQQRLLDGAAARSMLDEVAGEPVAHALEHYRSLRSTRRRLNDELDSLGGDDRTRARELDLLAFQLEEIDRAALDDVDEVEKLAAEIDALEHAASHRDALRDARGAIEPIVSDALGRARQALDGKAPFQELGVRLRALEAEAADISHELRMAGEAVVDDPVRLEAVLTRRKVLRDLQRKYGATLAEVIAYRDETRARADALVGHTERIAALAEQRAVLDAEIVVAAAEVSAARRAAAGPLSEQVTDSLHGLALAKARFVVEVVEGPESDDGCDRVEFLLSANVGEPPRPVAKAASGGELSRVMLALRLVAHVAGVETHVFDEIDAGIGGQAGVAIGRALRELGRDHQVLCVTHLPQVAVFADAQVNVRKRTAQKRTVADVALVLDDERVDELARMLGGVSTDTAREHVRELFELAKGRA